MELFELLVRDRPDSIEDRHQLAHSLQALADALRATRQVDEALAAYGRAAGIRKEFLRAEPGNIDYAIDLAVTWSNLGGVLGDLGRTTESAALLAPTASTSRIWSAACPMRSSPGTCWPASCTPWATRPPIAASLSRPAASTHAHLEIREALLREHPDYWEQQSQLARLYNKLGILHFRFHHPDEALSYYQKSLAIREKLLAAEPASAELQEYLARTLDNLGNLYNSLGRPAEALGNLERSRDLHPRFVAANPENSEMRSVLGGSLRHNLAMSYERLGRDADAERLYREAMVHQRRAREAQPEHMMYRVFLTNHLMNLGELLHRAGKTDDTAQLAEEAAGLWPSNPAAAPRPRRPAGRGCVESASPGDSPEAKARRDRFGRKGRRDPQPRV